MQQVGWPGCSIGKGQKSRAAWKSPASTILALFHQELYAPVRFNSFRAAPVVTSKFMPVTFESNVHAHGFSNEHFTPNFSSESMSSLGGGDGVCWFSCDFFSSLIFISESPREDGRFSSFSPPSCGPASKRSGLLTFLPMLCSKVRDALLFNISRIALNLLCRGLATLWRRLLGPGAACAVCCPPTAFSGGIRMSKCEFGCGGGSRCSLLRIPGESCTLE